MNAKPALPVEVREALDRLTRLDKIGALGADDAPDVRTLLEFVRENVSPPGDPVSSHLG